MPTVTSVVEEFIKLRDFKKKMTDFHKEQLAPLHEKLYERENWLLAQLHDAGVEMMRTEAGTVYKSTTTKAKVVDWPALKEFIKQDLEHIDLLEHRVSKEAVESYLEATGENPPGVDTSTEVNARVRR